MYACATLVVFISMYFSGTAIAKRLILPEEMCVCKQNPLYCVMKKSRLYHSSAMMFLLHKHTVTHLCTHAHFHSHIPTQRHT